MSLEEARQIVEEDKEKDQRVVAALEKAVAELGAVGEDRLMRVVGTSPSPLYVASEALARARKRLERLRSGDKD
jgi:hypothetical protein